MRNLHERQRSSGRIWSLLAPLPMLLFVIAFQWAGCTDKEYIISPGNPVDSGPPPNALHYTDVKPIFDANCVIPGCHGSPDQKNLFLGSYVGIMTGSVDGPVVIPRNSPGSLLYQRITSSDVLLRMPQFSPPLTAGQIDSIKKWIDDGAFE
jgi:hypothetical protein